MHAYRHMLMHTCRYISAFQLDCWHVVLTMTAAHDRCVRACVCVRACARYINNGASHPTNCTLICNTTGTGQCPTGATCTAINDVSIPMECNKASPPTCGQCAYTKAGGVHGEAKQPEMEGLAVQSAAAAAASAAGNYSIVPLANCTSELQICYQGTLEVITNVLKNDPVNFCNDQHATKVVEGNCAAVSNFTKSDGKDPIFTSCTLWSRPSRP